MADFIFRNGYIVDGTGKKGFIGDVAVKDGKIYAVGKDLSIIGNREHQCHGKLITPGWVDCHTHFDGQITWDPYCSPISSNGVTTIVFGNCGIGFAPCPVEQRDFLINLMEGVEDIPGAALSVGVDWNWETFPEFLNYLDTKETAIDFGAMVGHAPVRTYVMGLRGAQHATESDPSVSDPVTPEDIKIMAAIVEEAVREGAMGFSCSRSIIHRDINGNVVPGSFACEEEILALGDAVERGGGGVFETTSDFCEHLDNDGDGNKEMRMLREIALRNPNVPVSFSLAENIQGRHDENKYKEMLGWLEDATNQGAKVHGQISAKAVSFLMSLRTKINPLIWHPTFKKIRGNLRDPNAKIATHEEIVQQLSDPKVRAQLLAEHDAVIRQNSHKPVGSTSLIIGYDNLFPWQEDYEPDPAVDSIGAIARAQNKHPLDVLIDHLLSQNGEGVILNFATNYNFGNLETTKSMMSHPNVILGLGDGGAHVGFLTDAANCTYLLTHWVRDRKRGSGTLPLEFVVKKQTMETARLFGMEDRGTLEVGMKADVNVINMETLKIHQPHIRYDLPLDALRWFQTVEGYELTMLSGVVTFRNGKPTGELPGRLIRSPRSSSYRGVKVDGADAETVQKIRSKSTITNLQGGEIMNTFQKLGNESKL